MYEASERNFYLINFGDEAIDIIESDISQEGFDSFYEKVNREGYEDSDNITDWLVHELREKGFYADTLPNVYQYEA